MNNCFVNVCGGIGNQLFQLANGYAYSKKYDKNLYINDIEWSAGQGNSPEHYRTTIFKNFAYWKSHTSTNNGINNISERRFNYDQLPNVEGSVTLNGYFQSLKYFKEYKDEFISKLHIPEVEQVVDTDTTIAFHIRRGDYLRNPDIHHVCTTRYFELLFEKFKDRYKIDVFTDSPEYVLEEFKTYNFNIQRTPSELHDLSLMSQYTKLVCSNSTFSWWASLLGGSNKYIIVPERWFGVGFQDHGDIYRSDFTRIPVV